METQTRSQRVEAEEVQRELIMTAVGRLQEEIGRQISPSVKDNMIRMLRRGNQQPALLQAAVGVGVALGMIPEEAFMFGSVLSKTVTLDPENRETIPSMIEGKGDSLLPLSNPLKQAQMSIGIIVFVLSKKFNEERIKGVAYMGYITARDFLHPEPRTKEFLGNTVMNYLHQLP